LESNHWTSLKQVVTGSGVVHPVRHDDICSALPQVAALSFKPDFVASFK